MNIQKPKKIVDLLEEAATIGGELNQLKQKKHHQVLFNTVCTSVSSSTFTGSDIKVLNQDLQCTSFHSTTNTLYKCIPKQIHYHKVANIHTCKHSS